MPVEDVGDRLDLAKVPFLLPKIPLVYYQYSYHLRNFSYMVKYSQDRMSVYELQNRTLAM